MNATFGHGFEIDDFNPVASAHPGCVAVPAALSVGEREHLSGKDLLAGVALASEVITRVGQSGMKYMLARGFHETCTLGVFGASAVAAKMLGMDPKEIAYARLRGPVRRNETYRQARRALRFLANGFKPYAVRSIFRALSKRLTRIVAAKSLEPQDISEIVVPVSHFVMGHVGSIGPEPQDITGAQLSMHFSLGLTAVKRSNDFDTYINALSSDFKDPDVLEVARKVSLVEIPEAENTEKAAVPQLSVKTSSGKTYDEELLPSKGSPENPMTYQELDDKFMSLATRVMPKEQASKIAATVSDLENLKDLGDLTDLLVSPSLAEAVY